MEGGNNKANSQGVLTKPPGLLQFWIFLDKKYNDNSKDAKTHRDAQGQMMSVRRHCTVCTAARRADTNQPLRCLRAVGHPSPPNSVHVAYGCWG